MHASINRKYSHPVLSPSRHDYNASCSFQVEVTHAQHGADLKMCFVPRLRCPSLQACIDAGKAAYAYHLESPETAYRRAVMSRETATTVLLPIESLGSTLEVSLFIVATDYLDNFSNGDLWDTGEGSTFNLEPGAILASYGTRDIDIRKHEYLSSRESLFRILSNPDPACKSVEIDNAGEFIRIFLPVSSFETYRALREMPDARSLLDSLVALPALMHVLETMRPDQGSETGRAWYKALNHALRKEFGRDISSARLHQDESLNLAQKLLGNPVADAFDFAARWVGHERMPKRQRRRLRIPMISWENLDAIKDNLERWAPYFRDPPEQWLEEKLGRPLFQETKFEFSDFQLDMSNSDPPATDAANARILYENMMSLPPDAATDERLWAALCLGPFWDYVRYRGSLDRNCNATVLRENLFYGYGRRRSALRNTLARLWRAGHLTYDPTQADPWRLTSFICGSREFMTSLLERNTSNNIRVLRSIVTALIRCACGGVCRQSTGSARTI